MLPFEITLGCNLRERLSAWLYLVIKMGMKFLICPKRFSGDLDGMRGQVMGKTRVPWKEAARVPRAGGAYGICSFSCAHSTHRLPRASGFSPLGHFLKWAVAPSAQGMTSGRQARCLFLT